MVSRRLMAAWAVFDIALLVSGALTIAFSVMWQKKDLLLNMVISQADLHAGIALGTCLLVTFVVSIGAVVQRNHVTIGFVILNWLLIADAIVTGVIGSFVWFYTLQERANFHVLWQELDSAQRVTIQDMFSCCGYFSANDTAEVGGSFCTSRQFIDSLDVATPTNFCVSPITKFADNTLMNIFSSVYGFMAVIICLFLASLCVIKKRQEDERFKKIDAKRGGRGFV